MKTKKLQELIITENLQVDTLKLKTTTTAYSCVEHELIVIVSHELMLF